MIELSTLRRALMPGGALAALTQFPQFVLWKLEFDDGATKPRKVSYNARGYRCSAHEPSNWLTAQQALDLAELTYGGQGYGVAFVFSDADPFVFIDVDNCLVNGVWSDTFNRVWNQFGGGCMFEISQSGKGAHLFVMGNTPPDFRGTRANALECYRTKRFVALTGISAQAQQLHNYGDTLTQFVTANFPKWQKDSVELSYNWTTAAVTEAGPVPDDETVLQKFLAATPHVTPEQAFGAIFKDYAGDINAPVSNVDLFTANVPALVNVFPPDKPGESFDWSRGAYALACRLARFTGKNCEQTLRLMNRAAFRRNRADMHHDNDSTYMQWDVKRACGFIKADQVYRWGRNVVPAIPAVPVDIPVPAALPNHDRYAAINRHRDAFNAAQTRQELEAAAHECKNDPLITDIDVDTLAQELQKCFDMKACGKPRIALVRMMLTPERKFENGDTMVRDANGKIEKSQTNIHAALRKLPFALRFDTFTERVLLGDQPINDTTYGSLQVFIESQGVPAPSINATRMGVDVIAHENEFDSAQDWLKSLQWDGVPRVETCLVRVFGLADTPYHRAVSRYMWSVMAGRTIQPGVKADGVPVLVSPEGFAKTSFVEALVPREELYGLLSMDGKRDDIARRIKGKLVMEWGELDGLKTRERTAILNFITQRNEQYVEKYQTIETKYARRMLVLGTTNDGSFLDAHAAERRMLPITVERPCDLITLNVERDQLWAEAAVRFGLYGIEWQESQQLAPLVRDQFREVDPIESVLEQFFRTTAFGSFSTVGINNEPRWKMADIVAYVSKANVVKGRVHQQHIGKLLRKMGFEDIKSHGNYVWRKAGGAIQQQGDYAQQPQTPAQ
jgi:hypothetical protein